MNNVAVKTQCTGQAPPVPVPPPLHLCAYVVAPL